MKTYTPEQMIDVFNTFCELFPEGGESAERFKSAVAELERAQKKATQAVHGMMVDILATARMN